MDVVDDRFYLPKLTISGSNFGRHIKSKLLKL